MTERIISDPGRRPIVAQRKPDGGLVLNAHKTIMLGVSEVARLVEFLDDAPHPATPAKARLMRYPMHTA